MREFYLGLALGLGLVLLHRDPHAQVRWRPLFDDNPVVPHIWVLLLKLRQRLLFSVPELLPPANAPVRDRRVILTGTIVYFRTGCNPNTFVYFHLPQRDSELVSKLLGHRGRGFSRPGATNLFAIILKHVSPWVDRRCARVRVRCATALWKVWGDCVVNSSAGTHMLSAPEGADVGVITLCHLDPVAKGAGVRFAGGYGLENRQPGTVDTSVENSNKGAFPYTHRQ